MRIGIDASPIGVLSGGIKRYTEQLIDGLVELDPGNEIVLYGPRRIYAGGSHYRDFPRDPINFPGKRYLDPFHVVGAKRNVDLYHGTNYSVPLLTRIPTVVTIHDLTVQLMPTSHPVARRMRHQLLPAVCRRASRIITDSEHTRRDLARLFDFDSEKVDVISLGVSETLQAITDEAQLSNVREKYALPENFVLYLGALEPRKNLKILIDAIALVRDGGPDTRLVIAGSGAPSFVSRLKQHAIKRGLMLARDVLFPGHIDDADLAALYSASDLFVFPSRYEGFGLPPLESMACGVPVVLAENSSMADVFKGSCVMVDGNDARCVADSIRKTLADRRLRADLSTRGLELARSLGWKKTCSKTLAVYERAMCGPRS